MKDKIEQIIEDVLALANYRDWETANYQAPETHEGFALHLCGYTAMQIRKAMESEQPTGGET